MAIFQTGARCFDHLRQRSMTRDLGPKVDLRSEGICRRWCALLHPSGLAWRAATKSVASVAARNGSAVVQWTGVELLMPIKNHFADAELMALPLGARPELRQLPLQHWAALDYRWISQLLHRWRLAAECLPLCPLCAGVAYYQGSGFTRSDIATGWQSYMLCSTGPFPHPLITTLLANMGVPIHMAPSVLLQLRPSDLGYDEVPPEADGELPGLQARHEEPQAIDGFGSLWRGGPGGRAVMAQNIVSISLPCSRRLCIAGRTLKELGFTAFFCEQVNKTASTSRTRVGRYLDDQPARAPRAHVYGASNGRVDFLAELPTDSLMKCEETCPFCGETGRWLRGDLATLRPWDVELEDAASQDDGSSFHGSLWLCRQHLWGWRLRRAGVPVTMD